MPFITFEGADGAGKTTHIQLLADHFAQQGYPVLVTREPGGTQLGNEVRALVLGKADRPISPLAEAMLMAAARAQHVDEVLKPCLAEGRLILCDRYIDSSLVYQGVALGLGLDLVISINEPAMAGLWPDLTILLDVSPEVAYERSILGRQDADRIESRGLAYYRQVCAGYQSLAAKWPERFCVIDANRPLVVVQADVLQAVSSIL